MKFQPGTCLMYPFVASWFARCEELDQHDLSFLKAISISGSVLDTTTASLINKRLPHVKITQVSLTMT
jgi:non-ribosomal peptide synthetase component E (peptide arylation enzyme)